MRAAFRTVAGAGWLALVCVTGLAAGPSASTIVGIKLLKATRGDEAQPIQIQLPQGCYPAAKCVAFFMRGRTRAKFSSMEEVPADKAQIANVRVNVGDLDGSRSRG